MTNESGLRIMVYNAFNSSGFAINLSRNCKAPFLHDADKYVGVSHPFFILCCAPHNKLTKFIVQFVVVAAVVVMVDDVKHKVCDGDKKTNQKRLSPKFVAEMATTPSISIAQYTILHPIRVLLSCESESDTDTHACVCVCCAVYSLFDFVAKCGL